MDRVNAFTIEIPNLNNKELSDLLDIMPGECCLLDEQPEIKKFNIFWFEKASKELSKHVKDFNWISGDSGLWLGNEPLTQLNYRKPIYSGEGEQMLVTYEYASAENITDIAPIILEEPV